MTGAWGRCGIHFLLLWRPERVSSDGGLFWLLFGAALPPALPSFLLTEGGRRIRGRWGQGQGPQQEAPVPSSFLRAASGKPGAQPPRAGVRWGGPRAAERGGGSPAQPALPPGGAGCPPAGERGSSWCPLPPRVPPRANDVALVRGGKSRQREEVGHPESRTLVPEGGSADSRGASPRTPTPACSTRRPMTRELEVREKSFSSLLALRRVVQQTFLK